MKSKLSGKDATAEMQTGSNPLLVQAARGDDLSLCLKCYYIQRGSFGKIKKPELFKLLHRNPNLKKKPLGPWTWTQTQTLVCDLVLV